MAEYRPDICESDEEESEFVWLEEYQDNWHADHEAEEEEVQDENPLQGRQCRRTARTVPILPPVPRFEPLYHRTARHDHHIRYPATFNREKAGPLEYFQLFLSDDTFTLRVQNTNQYAASKNAGSRGKRSSKPTSIPEMIVFFGLIVYIGVFPSAQVKDYWSHDSEFPFHCIGMYLSQNRFEQLKRYFHVSEPYDPGYLPQSCWYFKVAPLADLLQARF